MKNVHILSTDKPSRLFKDDFGRLIYSINIDQEQNHFEPQHTYITSNEEIKEGDWYLYCNQINKRIRKNPKSEYPYPNYQKIILTTDQDLIKDGVQTIDDEFLEWFVKNPSCEGVEIGEGVRYEDEWIDNEDGGEIFQHQYCSYKIIIPSEENTIEAKQRAKNYMSLKGALEPKQIKCYCGHTTYCDCSPLEEPKQETLEEAAEKYCSNNHAINEDRAAWQDIEFAFKDGAKWQQERMYSEEEVIKIVEKSRETGLTAEYLLLTEQFKKK